MPCLSCFPADVVMVMTEGLSLVEDVAAAGMGVVVTEGLAMVEDNME